jgi:hypothetical protein
VFKISSCKLLNYQNKNKKVLFKIVNRKCDKSPKSGNVKNENAESTDQKGIVVIVGNESNRH